MRWALPWSWRQFWRCSLPPWGFSVGSWPRFCATWWLWVTWGQRGWKLSGLATNSIFNTFPLNKKYSICLESTLLATFLLATPSSLSQPLEGLFELTQRPSGTLNSPHVLFQKLQRKDIGALCEVHGSRKPPKTADINLDYAFVENTIFFAPILDCEKPTE